MRARTGLAGPLGAPGGWVAPLRREPGAGRRSIGRARPARERGGVAARWAPLLPVAAAVAFGLWGLRAELAPVANTDDGSVHSEMVRFALDRIRAGHFPLTSWFPFLGLGSPQFMHYQSLGATLTAVLGFLSGPDRAYSISLYVLLSTWPLSIYWSARLFRMSKWESAGAAVCSPFVASTLGIGYSEIAYVFVGFGLWSQLFAMWLLPLSWAVTWRAAGDRRFVPAGALLVAATSAFHFMTGYLAFLVVPVWLLLTRRDLARRVVRGLLLVSSAVMAAAWVVVPLLVFRPWASVNEYLAKGPDVNSYGAGTVMRWLVEGRLLDADHVPVLTALAG